MLKRFRTFVKKNKLIDNVCFAYDDQCFWNAFLLVAKNVVLDYDADFVLNAHGHEYPEDFHAENGRWVHADSATKPFAVHINGFAKRKLKDGYHGSFHGFTKRVNPDLTVPKEATLIYKNETIKFFDVCTPVGKDEL